LRGVCQVWIFALSQLTISECCQWKSITTHRREAGCTVDLDLYSRETSGRRTKSPGTASQLQREPKELHDLDLLLPTNPRSSRLRHTVVTRAVLSTPVDPDQWPLLSSFGASTALFQLADGLLSASEEEGTRNDPQPPPFLMFFRKSSDAQSQPV
jgi:hypothetical protein